MHHPSDLQTRSPLGRPIISLLKGELARLNESIEPLSQQLPSTLVPLLLLRLLTEKTVERYHSEKFTLETLASAIAALTKDEDSVPSLLNHHYAAFLARVLTVTAAAGGSVDAGWIQGNLERLKGSLGTRVVPAWRGSLEGLIGGVVVEKERTAGGLEGLAEAAVGGAKGNGKGKGETAEGDGVEWGDLVGKGWLEGF